MFRVKKGILAVWTSLVLVGSIVAGCSSGPQSTGGEKKLPAEITIGGLVPMTGSGASYGEMDMNGANLAVEQINAVGGVKGIKLKIKFEDHQAKPQVAVTGMNRLADVEKTPYVISSYSAVTLAVAPIGDQKKVVVMNAGGQSDNLANAGKFLYNDIPLVGSEVDVIAEYLAKEAGLKTASVIYANDDGGRSSLKRFKEAFAEAGGQIVGEEATELGGADFRAQLSKVKSQNPDVLFVATYGQDTALIIKQARELGIRSKIADTSWSVIPEVYNLKEAEGMIHTTLAFKASDEMAKAYKERYGKDPTLYAVTYYDGVKIFAKALEWVIDNKKPINGVSLKEAIDTIREFDGAAGKVKFADDHTSTKPITISVLENGKPKVIKTVQPK